MVTKNKGLTVSDLKWKLELRHIEKVRVIKSIKGLNVGDVFEVSRGGGQYFMQRGGNRRNENFLRTNLIKRNLSVVVTAS